MTFDPKIWCENQIHLAKINIQLKYFVDEKENLKNLWDGIMVGNSFRESAHLAARAQTNSLFELHKIIPEFLDDNEKYLTVDDQSKIEKFKSPLEYINHEISNNLFNAFNNLTKINKDIISNHLKENNYRLSILSETMKTVNDLEEVVREKLKNHR